MQPRVCVQRLPYLTVEAEAFLTAGRLLARLRDTVLRKDVPAAVPLLLTLLTGLSPEFADSAGSSTATLNRLYVLRQACTLPPSWVTDACLLGGDCPCGVVLPQNAPVPVHTRGVRQTGVASDLRRIAVIGGVPDAASASS